MIVLVVLVDVVDVLVLVVVVVVVVNCQRKSKGFDPSIFLPSN